MSLEIQDLTARHLGRRVRLSLRGGEVVHVGTLESVAHFGKNTWVDIRYDSGAKWKTSDLPWRDREKFTPDQPIDLLDEP